jgi:regulator of sirC expression with transglutaminase-like and TPR domain
VQKEKSIQALVQLIDDPDENIFYHVRDELINIGEQAIPFLEDSWEKENYGLTFQSRIEQLIHEIQFNNVKTKLQHWIATPEKDLFEGALIINEYQYPNLDENTLRESIQKIRKDIWLELNDYQTSYEKVRVFNKIFYGRYEFAGNSKDYHSPLNSFISTVLETKKGNPLSLSLIYSVIAQSLDMPIYGVNLPNHFILVFLDENGTKASFNEDNEHGALFYINAFSRGGIFDDSEIKAYLSGINKTSIREYFEPCSNSAILARMLTNLINSFQQIGNKEKVDELTQLRSLFDPVV